MTKKELSFIIASQSLWLPCWRFFKSWFLVVTALIILLTGFLELRFTRAEVSRIKHTLIPATLKKFAEIEKNSRTVNKKVYSIESNEKLKFSTSLSRIYKISSKGISLPEKETHFLVFVPHIYEEKFLRDVSTSKLALQYVEGSPDKPLQYYPDITSWKSYLNKINNESMSLYLHSLKTWASDFVTIYKGSPRLKESLWPDLTNSMFFISLLYFLYFTLGERKRVFLKNFNQEDLKTAEFCTIEVVKSVWNFPKKHGNTHSFMGQIYKVSGKNDVFVIYNGKEKQSLNGYLLKYGKHYFFIKDSWVPKNKSRNVA